MNIKDVNYISYGNNKKGVIVLLHGWGQNIQMMDMVGRPFKDKYQIIALDLPGFGKSKEPDSFWCANDYATFLHNFLENLNIKNPVLIGHSFGGRVAICYASRYKTKKVVLFSSPFRPSKSKKTMFKVKVYKFIKKIKFLKPIIEKLKNKWGSTDYKNASEILRGSLVKIVNEDLTENAKKILAPTLLIYGDCDKTVPIKEAQVLSNLIKDAGLIKYPGLGHYAYLENLNNTIYILNNFLG